MYYKRLFYRQFTNHFISGISNIHDLSIGTDSNSERMIEHSNVRTTQIYARVSPKRLFEDMDRFIEATRDLKLIL